VEDEQIEPVDVQDLKYHYESEEEVIQSSISSNLQNVGSVERIVNDHRKHATPRYKPRDSH